MTKLSSDEQGLFGIPMLGHIHGHKVRVAPPSSCASLGRRFCVILWTRFLHPITDPSSEHRPAVLCAAELSGSTLQKRRCEDHQTSISFLHHKCLYWHDASIFPHVRIISSWFWFQLYEECLIMFNNDPQSRASLISPNQRRVLTALTNQRRASQILPHHALRACFYSNKRSQIFLQSLSTFFRHLVAILHLLPWSCPVQFISNLYFQCHHNITRTRHNGKE